MNREKISSQEIIDQVSVKAKVSKRAAEEFLKAMISTIEDALISGEQVKVKGFGTFKLQWNEARKSVNVKTGEEIILDGYYKVAFTPESSLKELVNSPFAHLEPVLLDAANNFVIPEEPLSQEHDPLKAFTEQASEIKDILSEIKALSKGADDSEAETEKTESSDEGTDWPMAAVQDEDDDDDDIADELDDDISDAIDIVDENIEEEEEVQQKAANFSEEIPIHAELLPVEDIVVEEQEPVEVLPLMEEYTVMKISSEPEASDEALAVETDKPEMADMHDAESYVAAPEAGSLAASVGEVPLTESVEPEDDADFDLHATPFMAGARRKRAKRIWIVSVLIAFVCLGVGGFLLYYFNGTVSVYVDNLLQHHGSSAVKKEVPQPAKVIAHPVKAIPDSVKTKKMPTDTLSYLKQERSYDEFIASEQITKGERLEMLALKYYGDTVFWVYIFEANKERIDNPDMLIDGTLIRVPKLDHRLIDLKNPRCAAYANELAAKYLKK